jgi:tetratricopeptide (TPR) repeat protein
LPEEKRLGWRKAAEGAAEANGLVRKAQYTRALPLQQERLRWCREVLGEGHPATAVGYFYVAMNLYEQGKYPEAAALFQRALDINRKALGDDHPATFSSYTNLAGGLLARAKYVEAEPLLQKALDSARKLWGEGHRSTATSYYNVAVNLKAQGRYAEAEPLFQKALDINRKLLGEDHLLMATSYDGLAGNLLEQGRYAEAGALNLKALDIRLKALGEDHPDTALSYYNVGANFYAQGKSREAGLLVKKALDTFLKIRGEVHPDTAMSYNGVALCMEDLGKYAEAGPLFQKALDIRRKLLGEDHPDTAISYNSLAGNLSNLEKYAEAEPLFQKALDINRKLLGEDHPATALGYSNLASILQKRGKSTEAAPLFQKALDIRRRALGEDHPDTAYAYEYLAINLQEQGKYAAALESLVKSTRSYEAARLGVAARGLERATYHDGNSPHAFLAAARARAGQAAEAWAALEADLGRGYLDELLGQGGSILTPAEQRQRDALRERGTVLEGRVLALVTRSTRTDAEAAELERLIKERQQLGNALGELAGTVNRREVATLEQLQAVLPADAAFVAWVDATLQTGLAENHWGCVVSPKGEPKWEPLPGSGPDGKWTEEDRDLPLQFRRALSRSAPAADVEAQARKLHDQRLAPLAKHLTGVKRLFIAPAHWMAGIPIEALTDRYTVSYTPSGTFLARLKDRERPHSSGVLAVGDPLLPPAKEAKPPTALPPGVLITQVVPGGAAAAVRLLPGGDPLLPPAKEAKPPTALPPGGLLITQVVPGGAAAAARLLPGDVLVAYAGADLTSVEQLSKLIAANAGEKSVVAKVWREGQENLAERELPPGRLGVLLAKEPAREAITTRRQADQMLAKLARGDDYAELPVIVEVVEAVNEPPEPGTEPS